MTHNLTELDAHEVPSEEMRAEWKSFVHKDASALEQDPRVDDPRAPPEEAGFVTFGNLPQAQVAAAFAQLSPEFAHLAKGDAPIIHHPLLPGLLILPSLVPPELQHHLLDRMIHRDLSNPTHQTNMHLHYELPYAQLQDAAGDGDAKSFFSLDPESPACFHPKDPAVHKPLTIKQVLQRRLHWVTFGGQYDWTNRVYPDARPPDFPEYLTRFLGALFPDTEAQASILNFYTPSDTMMMHRDVSEETDKGLISLSFGCECLFMIAPNGPVPEGTAPGGKESLVLRLRSGDAIYMTNESRYAWHGVPKVVKGTCPDYLADWPAREDGAFEKWRGWMKTKRINLNVRQMKD